MESSAEHLSGCYGLPPVVHGAMVVAIGSSFPELSGTVLATLLHGDFELGLSVVVGSAIFNIRVIPGLSAVLADDTVVAAVSVLGPTFRLRDDALGVTRTATSPAPSVRISRPGS